MDVPFKDLSNVKCLSTTLAPLATAPRVGMKPNSCPEQPMLMSENCFLYSLITDKLISEKVFLMVSWSAVQVQVKKKSGFVDSGFGITCDEQVKLHIF